MTRAEKAERIRKILDAYYPAPGIPLHHSDPYTLLVSVLLSAQTTDARVNQVTPGLFAEASTPEAMVELGVTRIHRLAARWGLSNGSNVARTERDLKAVFPQESWGKVHLQIIYFGREHCPARGHDLARCPICGWAATKKRIREEARRR